MNIHGLKSNYINVLEEDGSVSFGGNQGWVVKDNGKKIETKMIGGAFLGVEPGPGEHELTFKFVPEGIKLGLIVSILSWITFFILHIVIYREKRLTVKGK